MRCVPHRYRFVELYYRRKGRNDLAKTQTVVIFLPDVRSCVPTRIEWDELNAKYKQHFETSLKKGGDDVDNNSSVGGGDTGNAGNLHGASMNENGSSDFGVPDNGAQAVIESEETKSTAKKSDRSEVAERESTTANNNEKALQINSLLLLLIYIEKIANLDIHRYLILYASNHYLAITEDRNHWELATFSSAITHFTRACISLGITFFINQNHV